MSSLRAKPLNDLCNHLDRLCQEPVAESIEQVERWENDRNLFLRERMKGVRPLPEEWKPLVTEALTSWHGIEVAFSAKVACATDDYLQVFLNTHGHLVNGNGGYWVEALPYREVCGGVVWNIAWVHALAWQMPLADPPRASEYKSIARLMLAIFYMEQMGKSIATPREAYDLCSGLEALFQIVFPDCPSFFSNQL